MYRNQPMVSVHASHDSYKNQEICTETTNVSVNASHDSYKYRDAYVQKPLVGFCKCIHTL